MHDCYRRCFVGPSGFAFGLQTAPRVKKKLIRNKYVQLRPRNFVSIVIQLTLAVNTFVTFVTPHWNFGHGYQKRYW
jgi:hypothetical protein